MKHLIKVYIILCISCSFIYANSQNLTIDPTGTYVFSGKVSQKGSDFYGYSGQIQVKLISEKKIAMTFNINKGAPTYNSGTFVDTLDYVNNTAIYTIPKTDPGCEISFTFNTKGVNVKQKSGNKVNCCGFESGVTAEGFYNKKNSEVPLLIDPKTGEPLK